MRSYFSRNFLCFTQQNLLPAKYIHNTLILDRIQFIETSQIAMCYAAILSLFCEIHGPTVLMSTIMSNESIESLLPRLNAELNEDATVHCEFCQSFQPKTWPCLTSFEPAVTFVSSRGGKGFKHISLRSLSCESGQQWITADNLLNVGILAYTFRVPDPTARGLSRLISLSIIATGMSKSAFLNSSASKLVFPKGPSNIVNDM